MEQVLYGNYWASEGALQKEYNELFAELVPTKGEANTIAGEMIRSIARLAHEFYNNGNFNAKGEKVRNNNSRTAYLIDSYYSKMLALLEVVGNKDIKELVVKVREIIRSTESNIFSDENEQIYNQLCEEVIQFVITNKEALVAIKYGV